MYNDFNYFKNFVNKGIFPKRMFLRKKNVVNQRLKSRF